MRKNKRKCLCKSYKKRTKHYTNSLKEIGKPQWHPPLKIVEPRKQTHMKNEKMSDNFICLYVGRINKRHLVLNHFARRDLMILMIPIIIRIIIIFPAAGTPFGLGFGIGKTVAGPKFLGFGIFFKNYKANCRSSSFSSSCCSSWNPLGKRWYYLLILTLL